jgi:uncharacterized protein with PhoU and TrkA domain
VYKRQEELVDTRVYELLTMVLETDPNILGVPEKIVFARFFESLEEITDAAAAMASVVAANLPISEVIELAEEESNEIVLKTRVDEKASDKTIEQLYLDDIGAFVVAIKKPDKGWEPLPPQNSRLSKDDIVILKLYSEKDEVLLKELEKRGLVVQEE